MNNFVKDNKFVLIAAFLDWLSFVVVSCVRASVRVCVCVCV